MYPVQYLSMGASAASPQRDGAVAASAVDLYRSSALSSAAHTRAIRGFGDAIVYVYSQNHGQFSVPFGDAVTAAGYVQRVDPRAMAYVAVVDVSEPDYPVIAFERSFSHRPARQHGRHAPTVTSGVFLPFVLGALGGSIWSTYLTHKTRDQNMIDAYLQGRDLTYRGTPIYAPIPRS